MTRERLENYLENIERIFVLNRRINPQTGHMVEFTDEEKKNILCMEGGTEMKELFKHEGKVQNDDTYEDAVRNRGFQTTNMYLNTRQQGNDCLGLKS